MHNKLLPLYLVPKEIKFKQVKSAKTEFKATISFLKKTFKLSCFDIESSHPLVVKKREMFSR